MPTVPQGKSPRPKSWDEFEDAVRDAMTDSQPVAAHLVDDRYAIEELIDVAKLRTIFEALSRASGISTGFVTYPDQQVLIATGWHEICARFHRACSRSEACCQESNDYLTRQLSEQHPINISFCRNGLVDGATPLIIHGQHVASLFSGQVLLAPPDVERFRRQAEAFGYDVQDYLAALERVPVVDEEQLRQILLFLRGIATLVMEQGLDRASIARAVAAREQEIRERAHTEAVLRQNLARLDSLIENMQTGVLFEGEDRRVLHANQAFARLFGLDSAQQIVGADCAAAAGAASTLFADPEAFVRGVEAQLAGRQRVLGTVLPLADGGVLERDYVPILVSGERHGHLWLYRDVTAWVQAQARREAALEALRQERDLSQALATAAAVVSRTLDPDEVLDRLLEEVSRVVPNDAANIMLIGDDNQARLARWRGYDRFDSKAFVATTVFDVDRVPNLRHMAASGEPMTIQDTTTYPGWVEVPEHGWLRSYAAAPIRIRGMVAGFLVVESATPGFFTPLHAEILRAFADHAAIALANAQLYREIQQELAERKRLEARLIQSQKMEAVGRLAGGVAHDFNNHLTAIGGYAELLLLSLDPEDPRRDDVAQICRAAERSASLTRQLLAFSRKQIIQPQIVDLNELIAAMEKMLRRLIGEDVTLVTALHPGIYRVRVDPGQIEQVLMNLTINARDAMPHGGRLLIETAAVEVGEGSEYQGVCLVPGPYALLSVSDDGVGMDADTLSHLFEPFFTTKEVGKGTGLGLATVYGIVKQNEGYIFGDSEPGRGSRFSIYLPGVSGAARPAGRPEIAAVLHPGRGTILLVEDDSGVRAFSRRVLEHSGYHVLAAADGEQALAVARAYGGSIHLLLTDVVMPGALGGRALATRLAAVRPEVRVLYMSGYPDDAMVQRGILEQGIDFLHKPFTAASLAAAVRDVLERT